MTPTATAPASAASTSTAARLRSSARLRLLWLLACLGLLAVLMVLSTMIGSRSVSIADVLAAYGGSADGFDQAAVAKRIPRTWLAVLAGAA
ncbi:MAG TPA: iron ABC transporter permease, partial [Candidatus Brevibacterium intestinigallinarum]|nr:iron ABC transporter permease [Candidatus Brevibacterium intestinigallinarum]